MSEQATFDEHRAQSRALVPYRSPTERNGGERPEAAFLAQLIACDRRFPAYRTARMADPDRRASAYGQRPVATVPNLNCSI